MGEDSSCIARSVRVTLLLSALLTLASPARSQGLELATGATIGAGLAAATNIVDGIIEKAGKEANYVVFTTATQVRLQIESLRLSARDVVNEGFNRFDNSQSAIFDNIQRSLVSLQIAADQPIEEARQTVESVQQILADTTPWPDEPTVLRSSPAVVGPGERDTIAVQVRGLSFDQADPRLVMGGVEAERVDLKQQEATFLVDASLFQPEEQNVAFVKGSVSLAVTDCKFFWLACNNGRKEFEIASLILPRRLADVQVSYNTRTQEKIYADRTFSRRFSKSTGDLVSWNCEKFSQGPHDPAYFIDQDTLQPVEYSVACAPTLRIFNLTIPNPGCADGQMTMAGAHGRGGHRWQIVDKSPGGYTVEICVQSQMHTLVEKRNGDQTVNLGWREYRMGDVVSPEETLDQQTSLNWGNAVELKLPQETNAITVKLEYFDGTSTIFSGSYADQYVDVSWNNATKQLILRARPISSISEIY